MKAIIINAYGSPDVLQESIVPFPKVGPRQVLIK
jgi:NADPH:quinone reductase-like Zn-dependent oxidoreductase